MNNQPDFVALHNHVVLDSIFGNLNTMMLLPLRLVSKHWKKIIDKHISRNVSATFWPTTKKSSVELNHFRNMEISNVDFRFSTQTGIKRGRDRRIFYKILATRGQIRKLMLRNFPLKTEDDFSLFEKILCTLPNLKILILIDPKISVVKFRKFHPRKKSFPSLREFRIDAETGFNGGLIVPKVLELFPKISTNFHNFEMDYELLKQIGAGKASRKYAKFDIKMSEVSLKEFAEFTGEMKKLSRKLQIKVLNLGRVNVRSSKGLRNVTEILRMLEGSLESLEIYGNNYPTSPLVKPVIVIPPLKNLRKLTLGLPFLIPKTFLGKPNFGWDLGRNLAQDFPLLEHFKLVKNARQRLKACWLSAVWEMWEPFIPPASTEGYEGFKFLKHCDLGIPQNWIGGERHLKWGKRVGETYLQIYRNANKGTMKNFIDWIQTPLPEIVETID